MGQTVFVFEQKILIFVMEINPTVETKNQIKTEENYEKKQLLGNYLRIMCYV